MTPESDIDILVEFLPYPAIDLIDYASLVLALSQLLGRKVDLVSKKGLKPLIRATVLAESRLLYSASPAGPPRLTLEQKLDLFDPNQHGAEVMASRPIGAESHPNSCYIDEGSLTEIRNR